MSSKLLAPFAVLALLTLAACDTAPTDDAAAPPADPAVEAPAPDAPAADPAAPANETATP